MAQKAQGAFRTISEVADWLDVPAHVLRFWESKFSQIKPVKRAGGRRYYRPEDMLLIGGIKKLLHDDGLTIRGVQKMITEEGVKEISTQSPPLDMPTDEEAAERRKARRARRRARSAQARKAKPPVAVAEPPLATPPEDSDTAEQAPFINVDTDDDPDNVLQFQGRGAAADADEDKQPSDEPAKQTTTASAEADPEASEGWEAPSEDEVEASSTAGAIDHIDPDPELDDVKISDRIKKSEATLKAIRRHEPGSIPPSDTLTALYDRLKSLRSRVGDDGPSR